MSGPESSSSRSSQPISSPQIFLMDLEKLLFNGNFDSSKVMYVPLNSTVRFVTDIGSILVKDQHHPPLLFSNYPLDVENCDGVEGILPEFSRLHFSLVSRHPSIKEDFRWYADLGPISVPGSFQFFFQWEESEDEREMMISKGIELSWNETGFAELKDDFLHNQLENFRSTHVFKRLGPFSFIVLPQVRIRQDKADQQTCKTISIDSLSCQTVLTKCLGHIDEWEQHAKLASDLRFNMIHFTPVQSLGASGSSYSVKNQQSLSSQLIPDASLSTALKSWETLQLSRSSLFSRFSPVALSAEGSVKLSVEEEAALASTVADVAVDALEEQKLRALRTFVDRIERQHGLLSMVDLVWNHTSVDSPWLAGHPEAGYNLRDFPHLRPAFVLDRAIAAYSKRLEISHPTIESVTELDSIISQFKREELPTLKLWQFFSINIEQHLIEFRRTLEQLSENGVSSEFSSLLSSSFSTNLTPSCLCDSSDGGRFGRRVHIEKALEIFTCIEKGQIQLEESVKRFRRALEAANALSLRIYDHDMDHVIQNIRNTVFWERIDANGAHLPVISARHPLVPTYFTILTDDATSLAIDPFREDFAHELVLANAGWVWNSNQSRDFALPQISNDPLPDLVIYGPHAISLNEGFQLSGATPNTVGSSYSPASSVSSTTVTVTSGPVGPSGSLSKNTSEAHRIRASIENTRNLINKGFFCSEAARNSVYFQRSLIVWSDCVKLHFGNHYEDNPWLWDFMKRYTDTMASIFHGFRLDNCHSTPLPLAQFLLDSARKIRPNLFVTAELFTGDKRIDALYCNALGLSSLIREAMQAHSPSDLAQLTRSSNEPQRPGSVNIQQDVVNSMIKQTISGHFDMVPAAEQKIKQFLDDHLHIFYPNISPQTPRTMVMDCTHDNLVPTEKRTPQDCIPNAALVAISMSSIGSVRGYDELVPHKIDVVRERRLYQTDLDPNQSILSVRRYLNTIHQQLSELGFSELDVKDYGNVFSVVRHNPQSHVSVYLIAHSAFDHQQTVTFEMNRSKGHHLSVPFDGNFVQEFFSARCTVDRTSFEAHTERINGLDCVLFLRRHQIPDSSLYSLQQNNVVLRNFPPGSIVMFKTELFEQERQAVEEFKTLLNLPQEDPHSLANALKHTNLVDLNILLFRCESEEAETSPVKGAYSIPGFGKLSYCGIAGIETVLRNEVYPSNNLNHPLLANICEGNWLMEYSVNRLSWWSRLDPVRLWMERAFASLKAFPRYLIPRYFSEAISYIYLSASAQVYSLMSPFVQKGNRLVKCLALGSVQMLGISSSSPLDSSLDVPVANQPPSLAAGLPFFSTGYMRNWGRDTFIAFRGMLLITGRFEEAIDIIKAFGSCVRHGLIPNLLDGGRNPRYNSRDSSFWFLQAIKEFFLFLSDHQPEKRDELLKCPIVKKFPKHPSIPEDCDWRKEKSAAMAEVADGRVLDYVLEDLIQEILQSHAFGINFKELAVKDDKMQEKGLQMSISYNFDNSFIYGGNQFNCGTWMDKMGESKVAKNWGEPATPRDGADVEIIGLLASTIGWLARVNSESPHLFAYSGVYLDRECSFQLSYKDWHSKLQSSFEKWFYIPIKASDDSNHLIDSSVVHRRGIYKDSVGAFHKWCDYQLRPNFPIAMAVAPELFDRDHACKALEMIEQLLVAPLGLKTLDPGDWNYRGDYSNSVESDDHSTSRGFNYHNGPEWLWVMGYYLRALLNFSTLSAEEIQSKVLHILHRHLMAIESSQFAGLPELTNTNGAVCPDSCPSQAWSMATILDVLYDLQSKLERNAAATL